MAPGTVVQIPFGELGFSFSRSSGAGGQNVNKVNTRVTLSFDVGNSPSLDEHQRQLIRRRLGGRINRDGILRISSDTHRTQGANKEEVIRRFYALLGTALHEQRPRRKTRVPKRARERRLSAKKMRGRLKQQRNKKISDRE
ncbi:MAG TPA: aminoacyl-tRNA hydrolase [Desulfobulbus sp.]|nr:aminoacyl-tRNA hydrolase [Desulfobulbus sp.]